MNDRFLLKGFADSVGSGLGFLLPVFGRIGSNGTFVQRVSDDGIVMGFEEIYEIEARMIYEDRPGEEVRDGDEPILAFAIGPGDVLVDRMHRFRKRLADRLGDPDLTRHAFLALEAADFVGDPSRRLPLAQAAFRILEKRNTAVARGWRDTSVLTPDVRKELTSETGRPYAEFERVVVLSRKDGVAIAGLPEDLVEDVALQRRVLDRATRLLAPLYDDLQQTLRPETVKPVAKREPSPSPEALIWLVDRSLADARALIDDRGEWRIDAFAPDQFESFARAAETKRVPAYAVVRRDRHLSIQELDRMLPRSVAMIELGSPREVHPGERGSLLSRIRIIVAPSGFAGPPAAPRAVAATVRQIVALANSLDQRDPYGEWIFLKARGTGASPDLDAYAAIYDRLSDMGTTPANGIAVVSSRGRRERPRYEIEPDDLFQRTRVVNQPFVKAEMRKSAADVAMIVPAFRNEFALESHREAVKTVLRKTGWDPASLDEGENPTFKVHSARIDVVQATLNPFGRRIGWDIQQLMRRDLADVSQVSIEADAGLQKVLAGLFFDNRLIANMRDLCSSNPGGGVWSLLGAQVRRHAGGLASKARTHFMALLINEAFRQDDVELRDHRKSLEEALREPGLGGTLNFVWSKVRQGDHLETLANVGLYAREGRSGSFTGTQIARLRLIVHDHGTAVRHLPDD